ncbi:MAG TPA: Crp/Fnr family transcriptional regulator [Gammaproteobacteria bacterium]|nr:Crp/Fnr family transcriptional regulator [Gammaproteobacteria bacterium]
MTATSEIPLAPGGGGEAAPELPWPEIRRGAQRKRIPAGTCLFHEAEHCTHFMWLLEGTVRVFKHSAEGREITLYRVTPGELCVLSLKSLIGGEGFPAVAVAETDLVGLMLDKHGFDRAVDECGDFRRYLLEVLARRLGDIVQLVSDITFNRLELRLCCLLQKLFEESGGQPLPMTHARLAHELGTTREMVSRILKSLEHKQCIRLARGKIQLLSPEALGWISHA